MDNKLRKQPQVLFLLLLLFLFFLFFLLFSVFTITLSALLGSPTKAETTQSLSQEISQRKIETFFNKFEKLVFALADDSFAIDWKNLEDRSERLIQELRDENKVNLVNLQKPKRQISTLKELFDLYRVFNRFARAGNLFYEQNQDPENSAIMIRAALKDLRALKSPVLETKDSWGQEKTYSLQKTISNLDNLIESNLQYLEENFGI